MSDETQRKSLDADWNAASGETKTDERTTSLVHVLEAIRRDCETKPETYLAETVVPHGGE